MTCSPITSQLLGVTVTDTEDITIAQVTPLMTSSLISACSYSEFARVFLFVLDSMTFLSGNVPRTLDNIEHVMMNYKQVIQVILSQVKSSHKSLISKSKLSPKSFFGQVKNQVIERNKSQSRKSTTLLDVSGRYLDNRLTLDRR